MPLRQKNFPFSIDSLIISDYSTGEPIVGRQLTGQSATLNVAIKTTSLEANEYFAPIAVEAHGGEISFDATLQEVPKKILNYCNQGSLTTTTSCASAVVGAVTNKKGTSVSTVLTAVAVSAGQHSSVKTDRIYIEALSTSTFKIVNSSKGLISDTLTVSGAGGVYDNNVAPGITFTVVSTSSFTTGDTAIFNTTAIHAGLETYNFGTEKVCGSAQYVNVRGVACNQSDNDRYEFELYKCLMTGVSAPMSHGDFMTISVHGDAMVDETLGTPAAGVIKQQKGA